MQCIQCKGKGLCGLPVCPITRRFHAQADVKLSASYQGSAPSVFVGSAGYPDVRGGPLLVGDSDHPPDWLARNLGIDEIVGIRARTIRGKSPARQFTGGLQEIALSAKPLDVDVAFTRPVAFSLAFDGTVAPVGLSGDVRKLDVVGSASVARVVDRVTSDTDLGATGACYRTCAGRHRCVRDREADDRRAPWPPPAPCPDPLGDHGGRRYGLHVAQAGESHGSLR